MRETVNNNRLIKEKKNECPEINVKNHSHYTICKVEISTTFLLILNRWTFFTIKH